MQLEIVSAVVKHTASFAALALFVTGTGCSSSTPSGANAVNTGNARIVTVYDEDVLLVGTTDSEQASDATPGCAPAAPKHVVKIIEPSKAKVTLRATGGAAPLAGATLRVTHLPTKQTWCATMKNDVVSVTPPSPIPSGLYAIQVSEPDGMEHRYQILWEQL